MADVISLGGYPTTVYRKSGARVEAVIDDLRTNGVTSAAHGLERTPDGFDGWLECVQIDTSIAGYSVGDKVPVEGDATGAGSAFSSITVVFDSENVHVVSTSGGSLKLRNINSGTGSRNIDQTDWKFVVIPYVVVPTRED